MRWLIAQFFVHEMLILERLLIRRRSMKGLLMLRELLATSGANCLDSRFDLLQLPVECIWILIILTRMPQVNSRESISDRFTMNRLLLWSSLIDGVVVDRIKGSPNLIGNAQGGGDPSQLVDSSQIQGHER